MTASPPRPIAPVGYPVALELSAAALVAAQLVLSWLALERLPSTVVPYFGAGGTSIGLPGAALEARLWTWMVIGLWVLLLASSLLLYRSVRSTPIPILSVALLAHLAVLRAGVIALNLNPAVSPRRMLLRALLAGLIALILAVAIERIRSRRLLVPALVGEALYDEPTPRGLVHWLLVSLSLGLPVVLLPTRVRVIRAGVVVITPVSYFVIPAASIEGVERARWLQALAGAGVNLASEPSSAVRLLRRRSIFPLQLSVTDPPRFIAAVERLRGDS